MPYSIGVLLQRKLRRYPVAAILQTLALLTFLAATFMESFLGYLNAPTDTPANMETHNRFVFLHMFDFPLLMAGLLVIWYFSFRREKTTVNDD